MILFKPEHVPMILNHTKTQTRRKGKRRWKVGSVHQAKTNFKKDSAFANLRILAVREEPLGCITTEDAKAEGYNSIAEYQQVYKRIYGTWEPEEEVHVVDFELEKALEVQK
jgi:hypothetical protein